MNPTKILSILVTWFILFLTILVQNSCQASELWVNTGGVSYHFDRSKSFNEVHAGFGVEWRANEDLSVMVGFHNNSLNLRSRYASVQYQPLHLGPVKIGVSVGALDGYPLKRDGGAFFAAIPMATIEGKRFGVNIGVIPDIPSQHIDGAVVVQFKVRIL